MADLPSDAALLQSIPLFVPFSISIPIRNTTVVLECFGDSQLPSRVPIDCPKAFGYDPEYDACRPLCADFYFYTDDEQFAAYIVGTMLSLLCFFLCLPLLLPCLFVKKKWHFPNYLPTFYLLGTVLTLPGFFITSYNTDPMDWLCTDDFTARPPSDVLCRIQGYMTGNLLVFAIASWTTVCATTLFLNVFPMISTLPVLLRVAATLFPFLCFGVITVIGEVYEDTARGWGHYYCFWGLEKASILRLASIVSALLLIGMGSLVTLLAVRLWKTAEINMSIAQNVKEQRLLLLWTIFQVPLVGVVVAFSWHVSIMGERTQEEVEHYFACNAVGARGCGVDASLIPFWWTLVMQTSTCLFPLPFVLLLTFTPWVRQFWGHVLHGEFREAMHMDPVRPTSQSGSGT